MRPCVLILCLAALIYRPPATAEESLQEQALPNYRAYSATLASSGQPQRTQFPLLAAAGYERVVYLAFSDLESAIADEGRIVKDLGMDYIHIPVDWVAPGASDFYAFAGALSQEPDKKTLVHCELNFRASMFTFLYRVISQEVPLDEALDDLQSVWLPSETWREYAFAMLRENGIEPECDDCFWE